MGSSRPPTGDSPSPTGRCGCSCCCTSTVSATRRYQIASLFLLYEFFGIVTNAVGGWIGARLGLNTTLYSGLALQVGALGMLSALDPGWAKGIAVTYVMAAQALSGIAKDLTKMSSKSAIKVVVADGDESALFKWVAVLTGSKNTLKGAGFFLGGLLLGTLGFRGALIAMAIALAIILVAVACLLPRKLGKAKSKVRFRGLFSMSRGINVLSAARFFLFGARDVWFVVALPIFLADSFSWGPGQVGAYLAFLGHRLRLRPGDRTEIVPGPAARCHRCPAGSRSPSPPSRPRSLPA